MPSAMSYLDTSLIQEWGAYPVNGKIWCTLGHYERIVLQQLFLIYLFFAVEAVWSNFAALQSYKVHTVNLNAMKIIIISFLFFLQLMLCTRSNFGTGISMF